MGGSGDGGGTGGDGGPPGKGGGGGAINPVTENEVKSAFILSAQWRAHSFAPLSSAMHSYSLVNFLKSMGIAMSVPTFLYQALLLDVKSLATLIPE